jgi:hypothetical protein
MKLNSKLTGGLAWAGLILVLAVPSADMLTKASGNAAATMTSDMEAVDAASVAPAAADTVAPGPRVILARPGEEPVVVKTASEDPVDQYLSSGKKLPSYISDAPAEVASKEPVPVTQLVVPKKTSASASAEPVEVAAVSDSASAASANLTPPLPYPASMRPRAPVVSAAAIPKATEEAPVIVDEELVARREAAVAAVLGNDPIAPRSPGIITGEELEEWDSGSLAEYLERRGLMSRGSHEATRDDFDEDGFFLDEGPNGGEERLRRRLRRDFIFF